jgi:hypothetical protein
MLQYRYLGYRYCTVLIKNLKQEHGTTICLFTDRNSPTVLTTKYTCREDKKGTGTVLNCTVATGVPVLNVTESSGAIQVLPPKYKLSLLRETECKYRDFHNYSMSYYAWKI